MRRAHRPTRATAARPRPAGRRAEAEAGSAPPGAPARQPVPDGLVILALTLVLYFVHLGFARDERLSPDAAGYLDMGRNLFSGRGAVSTYNLYQYWPGIEHPMLPYMQPLYPVLCGLLWGLGGLSTVTAFNILLFALNCGLVYRLAAPLLGRPTAAMVGLLVGFSPTMLFSAIHPWTEELHLTTLLGAVLLYLRPGFPRFAVGVLLAIGCLVRFAGLYNAAGLLAAGFFVHGLSRRAWREAAWIAAGFLAVAVPYEVFCLLRYGSLYPEYPAAATRYTLAVSDGGAVYRDSLPVLNVARAAAPAAGVLVARFGSHAAGLVDAFGAAAPLGVAALFAPWLRTTARRDPALVTLLCLGVISIVAYSASLAWLPGIEGARYSVVPFMTLVPAGIAATRAAAARWLHRPSRVFWVGSLAPIALTLLALIPAYRAFVHEYQVRYPASLVEYRAERDEVCAWIREHAAKDALVASEFLKDPIFFERPFVSLPSGAALDSLGLSRFLAMYRPDYVFFANPVTARYFSGGTEYWLAKRTRRLILLERAESARR